MDKDLRTHMCTHIYTRVRIFTHMHISIRKTLWKGAQDEDGSGDNRLNCHADRKTGDCRLSRA